MKVKKQNKTEKQNVMWKEDDIVTLFQTQNNKTKQTKSPTKLYLLILTLPGSKGCKFSYKLIFLLYSSALKKG